MQLSRPADRATLETDQSAEPEAEWKTSRATTVIGRTYCTYDTAGRLIDLNNRLGNGSLLSDFGITEFDVAGTITGVAAGGSNERISGHSRVAAGRRHSAAAPGKRRG
jgi:hypothetical protein